MAITPATIQEARLKRLCRVKGPAAPTAAPLGPVMLEFFRQSVQKRHTRLGRVAECWTTLIPQAIDDHCALESFHRGTLTVIVDTAAHLYELKQLLLAGLQQQLLAAARGAGLRKIVLKSGRWYEGADAADRRPRFS